ncbi:MAG TPA: hypothetical protein VM554_09645 [Acidisarcina sp.]|nr:hypothetical protein [Acidisarcina sp.]
MLPANLNPESFKSYPPQARQLAVSQVELLRQLPAVLVPVLLHEVIAYDWKFPRERKELEDQFQYLRSLPKEKRDRLLAGFSAVTLPEETAKLDWVNAPGEFLEHLTASLWATHQMDRFRAAADEYAGAWHAAIPEESPSIPRLGIVVIGSGVDATDYPLFRKLRPSGVHFTQVSAERGLQTLLSAITARAAAHPEPYAHWYIDGGESSLHSNADVTCVSYSGLEPARNALLTRMQRTIESGSGGPEALRTMLAQMKPQDLGLPSEGPAALLSRFQISLLTEGSGTQIFSTTFAQWAAREVMRRAQPISLLVRFSPRQRQRPMNELLSSASHPGELDPAGSLLDADMGAYYTWLNQQRLSGAKESGFLVWFEGHNQALAIGPTLPRGTTSSSPTDLKQILVWLGET